MHPATDDLDNLDMRHATNRAGAMVDAVQGIDDVTGFRVAAPLSLEVGPGQVVALLFPPGKPRTPILSVLDGLALAASGGVYFPGEGHIMLVATRQALSDALSLLPALVLLDVGSASADNSEWAGLAGERGRGTSLIVVTTSLDQACRCDGLRLVAWDMHQLTRAMADLLSRMTGQTDVFLEVLGQAQERANRQLTADLLRLNVASRALLAEMGRCAHAGDEMAAWRAAKGQVAAVSLNDRVISAGAA